MLKVIRKGRVIVLKKRKRILVLCMVIALVLVLSYLAYQRLVILSHSERATAILSERHGEALETVASYLCAAKTDGWYYHESDFHAYRDGVRVQ